MKVKRLLSPARLENLLRARAAGEAPAILAAAFGLTHDQVSGLFCTNAARIKVICAQMNVLPPGRGKARKPVRRSKPATAIKHHTSHPFARLAEHECTEANPNRGVPVVQTYPVSIPKRRGARTSRVWSVDNVPTADKHLKKAEAGKGPERPKEVAPPETNRAAATGTISWPRDSWMAKRRFERLFAEAAAGERVVYHVGYLPTDRVASKRLERTAGAVMLLGCPKDCEAFPKDSQQLEVEHGLGMGFVTQRRVGEGEKEGWGIFEYSITRARATA